MSTKLRENITTRYGESKRDVYQQVIDLVKKNGIAKSEAQFLLVQRGLQHTTNPEPLVKEVLKDRYSYCKDCKGRPESPKKEPVAMEDHITDESIGGDHKTGRHLSGDTLMTQDKADPPNKKALEAKKSPEGDGTGEEKKGIGGWIALGGFLALIFGPMVYSWVKK